HVGTFTPEGTWEAAIAQLPELARAGMTLIEVMPLAEFPGKFGWGYDGVYMFSPTRLYGRPDDFRRFVDRAHALGVGVILDVVYNHFGSVGNYLREFSDFYFSKTYGNEWSEALNFDDRKSGPVREFFEANARYWIEEFHLDGFRFDATQAIHDASPENILAAVARASREAAAPRTILLAAENGPQDVRQIKPPAAGGYGLDMIWNDDFHHAARVRTTGNNEGYYWDFLGAPQEFIATARRGFVYQGQFARWQGSPRGTPTTGLPAAAFVTFLENHDQVANSATGQRPAQLASPGVWRAMTTLWLLSPQTPMFFQGQEFGATTPFLYFADFSGREAKGVATGRANFLKQFPSLATPEAQARLHNPTDPAIFQQCKLNFAERTTRRELYDLHIDLLALRRDDPVFRQQQADRIDGAALGADCLVLRYFGQEGDDRLLLVNFGRDLLLTPVSEPLLAPPAEREWTPLWSSADAKYGGGGAAPIETKEGWRIPGETGAVLAATIRNAEEKNAKLKAKP
ncbi:MAG: DUF3459 domain-containing protein, partial [Planctomycetia bacterium]|nr:DUF3459 domain-containing protein [Planctomycetia bacterium]